VPPAAPPAPRRTPSPRHVPASAGDSPAAAVLVALTAGPGDATVAVIAGHAQISVAARAPAPEAVGDPGTSAETTASAA
jgi:hypothetical protein